MNPTAHFELCHEMMMMQSQKYINPSNASNSNREFIPQSSKKKKLIKARIIAGGACYAECSRQSIFWYVLCCRDTIFFFFGSFFALVRV